MALYKRKSIYKSLEKKIIFVIMFVSLIPLLFLGATIYYRFAIIYHEKIEDQIKYRARSQCDALQVFLRERTAILSAIVDTHSFDYLRQSPNLSRIFDAISRRTDGLIDIGVIDSDGDQLAYVGPYPLEGLNYAQQPWFGEVMSKGKHISDVYMGYRQSPHFVIALRGYHDNHSYIIRTTIDPDVFNKLVRVAHTGITADAYIVSKDGVYQTAPRFYGKILDKTNIDTRLFGEGITVMKSLGDLGTQRYVAGAWLENKDWLLVISEEVGEKMGGLIATRNTEILIIVFGCLAIIVTIIFTTRIMFRHLDEADRGISELNAQLIQSDKMAALGKMAAGIAHEINNPLAVIGEKAGWMRDLLEEESFRESENFNEYVKSLDKIEDHVERARKITHNMLGFARRMEPRLDDVDINSVLNQTLDLLENHARINNIEIQKDLQAGLPIIASNQSQLQQVFLNLINNAIDAIVKDGRIDIASRQLDSNIVVHIKDNGPGIPEEYRNRIFDPFFTTKQAGKGTGLGLSVSYSIIEKLGGHITFESAPLKGCTFTVILPIVIPEKK